MTDSVDAARKLYAEELRSLTHLSSPALFAAFATVPRERFAGPGPWRVMHQSQFRKTADADPRHLYHNVLISLDEAKGINNGQPSLWAYFLDQLAVQPGDQILHLGCGTGYYTAILAEMTGPQGKITAMEIDTALAERARMALAPWPQVAVLHEDGSKGSFDPVDSIVVSAGATHPLPAWLDAIKPCGKLLFPLTVTGGAGAMALLSRNNRENFTAHLHFGTYFIAFSGTFDLAVSNQLSQALHRDKGEPVRSLRRDAHEKESSCWLHGEGWCFSIRAPLESSVPP